MKNLIFLISFLLTGIYGYTQLSGTKTVPGDFPSIREAINQLNITGVGSGGVTFHIAAGYIESSTDSLVLTATGTSADPIIFQKSGSGENPLIQRTDAGYFATTTPGANGDAVINIQGGDFISFLGVDVKAFSSFIEYGYFLTKKNSANASKNILIKNCNISLNKGVSASVTGIMVSNQVPGGSVSSPSGVIVTSSGGRSENITITGNTISNTVHGICVYGYQVSASTSHLQDHNIIIGGAGPERNLILNIGQTTGVTYGIYLRGQNNATITNNYISTESSGSTTVNFIYGIQNYSLSTNGGLTVSKNKIEISAKTGGIGIDNYAPGAFTAADDTITFNNNTGSLVNFSFISNRSSSAAVVIQDNILAGSFSSSSACYGIYNFISQATYINVLRNRINVSITGTPTFYGYYNDAQYTGTEKFSRNYISGSIQGPNNFYGMYAVGNLYGGSSSVQIADSNQVSDVITGTGILYGIYLAAKGEKMISNNVVYDFQGEGYVRGIYCPTVVGNITVRNNKIGSLTSTGGSAQVTGIVTSGQLHVYNNIIGNLNAPNTSRDNAIIGINIETPDTCYLSYNTIYLNATSSGTNFGSTAIYTKTKLTAKNNIIINTSVPKGNGLTCVFRSPDLAGVYESESNNNLYYAGLPGPSRVIYYSDYQVDQTLNDFKTRLYPADSSSNSGSISFLSTVGNSPDFLRIHPSSYTAVKSRGKIINAINHDYDYQTRFGNAGYTGNGTAPDIGADEIIADCVTNHWTGAVGTAWENPLNWSCGTIPGPNSNVIIAAGFTVILSSNTTINTLTLNAGAILNLATGVVLTVLN